MPCFSNNSNWAKVQSTGSPPGWFKMESLGIIPKKEKMVNTSLESMQKKHHIQCIVTNIYINSDYVGYKEQKPHLSLSELAKKSTT